MKVPMSMNFLKKTKTQQGGEEGSLPSSGGDC